jgi:STE24 endopeptidase
MTKGMFFILLAYLIVQTFEYWLKYINLRHMKKFGMNVPPGFEGYIDEPLLKKTHAYTLEHTRHSFFESIFGNVILLIFIFGGLMNAYNSWLSSLNLPFLISGLLFFLSLTYAGTILSIPFSLYSTFRIENKYGFNTTTIKLWIADLLKSMALSTVLMGIVITIGLWIVRSNPDSWWLFVWGFFFLFSIFMMYVSPYVIEPLFNKFTPLEGEGLPEKIRVMMEKTGIRVSRVFRIDASKRSRHTNAYFTGIGKVKRIVLYDTLLSMMEEDEVLAVLAHEAGHWKKKHLLKMLVLFESLSLIAAYVIFRILQSDILTDIFRLQGEPFFSKLVILGFLAGIVLFPFTPFFSGLSRRHELEADRFAVGLSPKPEALAISLIKLSKDNLSNLYPHPLYASIYYSHPPVVERVRKIKDMAHQ